MMGSLMITSPGPFAHIQDGGRNGFEHLGISRAGALDYARFALAQRRCGNDLNAAAVEMTYQGMDFRVLTPLSIATAGVRTLTVNGRVCDTSGPTALRTGSLVHLGPLTGVRGYLAVAGGIDVPVVLGSRSTDFTAAIGGLDGRALRAGDTLKSGPEPTSASGPPGVWPDGLLPDSAPMRVILGPRSQCFSSGALRILFTSEYTLHPQSNIMGLRLKGPKTPPRANTAALPSEGTVPGAIQIPPDGQPIILLNQRGTTGGYPVAGVIVTPDLWRLAQWSHTTPLRFCAVTLSEGQRISQVAYQRIEALMRSV